MWVLNPSAYQVLLPTESFLYSLRFHISNAALRATEAKNPGQLCFIHRKVREVANDPQVCLFHQPQSLWTWASLLCCVSMLSSRLTMLGCLTFSLCIIRGQPQKIETTLIKQEEAEGMQKTGSRQKGGKAENAHVGIELRK